MERTHLLLLPIKRKITAKGQSSTSGRRSGARAPLPGEYPGPELAELAQGERKEGGFRKFPHVLHESGQYIAILRGKRVKMGRLLDF